MRVMGRRHSLILLAADFSPEVSIMQRVPLTIEAARQARTLLLFYRVYGNGRPCLLSPIKNRMNEFQGAILP